MKTVEEIRKLNFSNQKEFADLIGISGRAYTNKISGVCEWKLSEILTIAALNDGEVNVKINGKDYNITVKEGI